MQLISNSIFEIRIDAKGRVAMGAGRRESRPTATVVASASDGADAHASDESVACRAVKRKPAAQEGAVILRCEPQDHA